MLQVLHIQNVALIEELELVFSDGFHVLTGETGAGKSIIIDAVNFVMGERTSRDIIKTGAQKASVQASFSIAKNKSVKKELKELGYIDEEEDDQLIIGRDLTASGKNTCRINGSLVNLSVLKRISDCLVDLHGQHEHQSLLRKEQHILFLDAFAGEGVDAIKKELRKSYSSMQATYKQMNSGFLSEQERLRRLDILSYQIDEIEKAGLAIGEEEALTQELQVLGNAKTILSALETSYAYLLDEDDGALTRAGEARQQLESIRALHEDYEDLYVKHMDAYYALEEVGHSLREMNSAFEFQPDRLQYIEQRLGLIHALERKYGASVSEILEFYQSSSDEYEALKKSDALRETLKRQYEEQQREYLKNAKQLSALRAEAARKLEKALVSQLKDLGMEKARFEVKLSALTGMRPEGLDEAEFLLSTNAGEPVKPLNRVASGGELSRIMLAFKTIHLSNIQTVIFDEIDTGISGYTATVVGDKMRKIASSHQVLCVTHLAQIAAKADVHFLVQKKEIKGNTISEVTRLDEEGRVAELAHIMGATQTDVSAMEHARELLQHARHEA